MEARYYRSPAGGLVRVVRRVRGVPDTWTEITPGEYEQELAGRRAEEAARLVLRQARAPQVDAARALIGVGLSVEQAAVVAGVTVDDLDDDLGPSLGEGPGGGGSRVDA